MKKLSFGQKILGGLFIILAVNMFLQYFRVIDFFIPSEDWLSKARIIIILFSLMTLIMAVFIDSIHDQYTKRRNNILINANKYIALAITPVVFFFMTYPFVAITIPAIYTKLAGQTYESYVPIGNTQDISKECYLHRYTHKAINSQFFERHGYLNKLCISNTEKETVTVPTIMLVEGRESLMGRTIADYSFLPSELVIGDYQELAKDAENFWGAPIKQDKQKSAPPWPPITEDPVIKIKPR